MDQIKPLSDFFTAIDKDPRISITHIGLYAALIQYWSEQGFENPVHVFSYEIMKIAKISASTTYHKNISTLKLKIPHYLPKFMRLLIIEVSLPY